MKILFITERFPWPLMDGGNLRTWHILQGLRRQHDVTVVAHRQHVPGAEPPPDSIGQTVLVPKQSLARRMWQNVRQIGTRRWPLFLLKNWSFPLLHAADELLATEAFDAIHFNHLDTACFALARDWQQPLIFDTHNCLTFLARQVASEGSNPVRRWLFHREARLLEQVERQVVDRMSLNLVCSRVDAENLASICPRGQFEVVPNGVDTEFFERSAAGQPELGTLVFTGAMSYYPNEQAALFFCREILPLLRAAGRAVRVMFVGKDPSPKVKSLHNGQDVIVTGAVPDVRPYLQRAPIVVVPLRHGSGTRLKILEAFAMGKAVVSTRVGAEGLDVQDGQNLLLADEPEAFAKQISRLLDDPPLRDQIGSAARALVESEYAWPVVQQRMTTLYSQVPTAMQCMAEAAV